MLATMATEYWYVKLPAGAKMRGEQPTDTINRELAEMVGRGWEPMSVLSNAPSLAIYVMFKKEAV
jgi:hypothetical protein